MSKRFFVLFLLAFSVAVVSAGFSAPSVVAFGSGVPLQVVTNSTTTNFVTVTGTVSTTTQTTSTRTFSTNSTTTSITTTITSTTFTFPSIVMSTTVISVSQTQIISLTTTTTHTTNALALVWQGQDMTTIIAIAIFAIICIGAVVVFKVAGQKGDKPVGTQRKTS